MFVWNNQVKRENRFTTTKKPQSITKHDLSCCKAQAVGFTTMRIAFFFREVSGLLLKEVIDCL